MKTSFTREHALLHVLEIIRERVTKDHRYYEEGICNAVNQEMFDFAGICITLSCWRWWSDISIVLFESWAYYSGNSRYPVPPVDEDSAYTQYQYGDCLGYFNPDTEYGQLRLDLLDHMIARLSEELRS